MEKLYTVSKNKTRSWLWLRSWTNSLLPNSDDLNWRKVGKSTKPFRYDLNQTPYDYTLEVRNRFKGSDLTDRVPDEPWTEICDTIQETRIKTMPMEKKCKKVKWLSGEALQIAEKRREAKAKEKRKDMPIWMQSSWRIARRDKKALLSDQCKETEENNRRKDHL